MPNSWFQHCREQQLWSPFAISFPQAQSISWKIASNSSKSLLHAATPLPPQYPISTISARTSWASPNSYLVCAEPSKPFLGLDGPAAYSRPPNRLPGLLLLSNIVIWYCPLSPHHLATAILITIIIATHGLHVVPSFCLFSAVVCHSFIPTVGLRESDSAVQLTHAHAHTMGVRTLY